MVEGLAPCCELGSNIYLLPSTNFMLHTFMRRCRWRQHNVAQVTSKLPSTTQHRTVPTLRATGSGTVEARRIKPSAAIQVEKFKPTFPAPFLFASNSSAKMRALKNH